MFVKLYDEAACPVDTQLTEALEQQMATSEILRVISSSPTDVQPVFDVIARSAAALRHVPIAGVFRYDGELVHFVAANYPRPEALEAAKRAFPIQPSADILATGRSHRACCRTPSSSPQKVDGLK